MGYLRGPLAAVAGRLEHISVILRLQSEKMYRASVQNVTSSQAEDMVADPAPSNQEGKHHFSQDLNQVDDIVGIRIPGDNEDCSNFMQAFGQIVLTTSTVPEPANSCLTECGATTDIPSKANSNRGPPVSDDQHEVYMISESWEYRSASDKLVQILVHKDAEIEAACRGETEARRQADELRQELEKQKTVIYAPQTEVEKHIANHDNKKTESPTEPNSTEVFLRSVVAISDDTDPEIQLGAALREQPQASAQRVQQEVELAVALQLASENKTALDDLEVRLDATLVETQEKDQQSATYEDMITNLKHQNEGLASIVSEIRETGGYYMKRAHDLAGLLEGRTMSEEDKKLLEEKDSEILALKNYATEVIAQNEDFERRLSQQTVFIDERIPALMREVEKKDEELLTETSRSKMFKMMNVLKAEMLRGFQPDELVDVLREDQRVLTRDNSYLTKQAEDLKREVRRLTSLEKLSQQEVQSFSTEKLELGERVRNLEDEKRTLEGDVDGLKWQVDLKNDAFEDLDTMTKSTIADLNGVIASLNLEINARDQEMIDIIKQATRFLHRSEAEQDDIRARIGAEELARTKNELEAVKKKASEDQADLVATREQLEYYKGKEIEHIKEEPFENERYEHLRKRLVDAEAAAFELRERLKMRDSFHNAELRKQEPVAQHTKLQLKQQMQQRSPERRGAQPYLTGRDASRHEQMRKQAEMLESLGRVLWTWIKRQNQITQEAGPSVVERESWTKLLRACGQVFGSEGELVFAQVAINHLEYVKEGPNSSARPDAEGEWEDVEGSATNCMF